MSSPAQGNANPSNNNLTQICISLTSDEEDLESDLKKRDWPVPSDFQVDIAWELANLTRIAYKDYELFNGSPLITIEQQSWGDRITCNKDNSSEPDKQRHTLQAESTLYTSKTISKDRIDNYFIEQKGTEQATNLSTIKEFYGDDYLKYRILTSYDYIAYSFKYSLTPIPDVDKFGFIAERESNNGKLIFVVFRGTRESEEWFVNTQFKQLKFLQRSPKEKSDLDQPSQNEKPNPEDETPNPQVSLGFNKIYTDFRPGLFLKKKSLNQLSMLIENYLINRSQKKYSQIHGLHEKSILKKIEDCLNQSINSHVGIYLTGHSLGGAIATISALHISQFLESRLSMRDSKPKIFLYTFASPRVGNPDFAQECRKKFKTYRIANSEDVVPGLPPGTFRFLGEEMLPGPVIPTIRNILECLTSGVTKNTYEHVGYPIYFTSQLKKVSSNHNMNITYCNFLKNITKPDREG